MGFSFEGFDLKNESKELKPTSKCFKDYISSLKKTGNCEPATVNGYNLINTRTPMGRWGYLPEMEGGVIFSTSPASGLITGQTIYIDGGWTSVDHWEGQANYCW